MHKLLFIGAMFLSLLFNSCSDNIVESTPSIDQLINNPDIITATFSDIQTKVFNKSCALSGCHVTGVQFPDLSGNSYNTIVNKPSSNNKNYIQPGSPSLSYIYLKLTNSNEISGTRMPQNSPPLSNEILDSISVWISNGALNN